MLAAATSAVSVSPTAQGTMLVVVVPAAPPAPSREDAMKPVWAAASPMRKLLRPLALDASPRPRPMTVTVARFRRSKALAISEVS